MALAEAEAAKYGRELVVTTDPEVAVAGADVVATDTWISMGQEEEKAKRMEDFAGYVNVSCILFCSPVYYTGKGTYRSPFLAVYSMSHLGTAHYVHLLLSLSLFLFTFTRSVPKNSRWYTRMYV